MKIAKLLLLGLLVVGVPFIPIAGQAAVLDPEEMFEDNPARFDEAIEEGKIIVPDISALGLQGQVHAGGAMAPGAAVRNGAVR